MRKQTSAMRLVILPVSFKDRAVGVDHSAPTICHVVLPVSFVDGSVLPSLHAPAVSLALDPFAFELAAIWQLDEAPPGFCDSGLVVFASHLSVVELWQVLSLGSNSLALCLELIGEQSAGAAVEHAR